MNSELTDHWEERKAIFEVLKDHIDYSKIRKDELKQVLKPYKKELGIVFTNIKKKDLIKYVKEII